MLKLHGPTNAERYLLKVLAIGLVCCGASQPAGAQQMDKQVENAVKQAAVQVWMGEAQQGADDMQRMGSGSGSFVNRSGLVITNNHVIDPGHGKPLQEKFQARIQLSLLQYRIVVNGGTEAEKEYKAEVLYQNEAADLALLQAYGEDEDLLDSSHFLPIQGSDNLQVGDRAWLFGFPGGDKMSTRKDKHAAVTVTAGNITRIPRTPGGRIPRIDTDVKAAQGNSGGPLVNAEGELIAIVSQLRGEVGTSQAKGDGLMATMIPGDLVQDMIKVALALGKVSSDNDLEPFLNLLADREGRVFLPGLERQAHRATLKLRNGDEIVGTVVGEELTWKTPLGTIKVPVKLAAYAVGEDGKINLLLDGGDRLSASANDVEVNFITSRGKNITLSMSQVAKLAFVKPQADLVAPNVEAIMIEGEHCRIVLTDAEGDVRFKTEGGLSLTYKLDEIKRIETHSHKQVITTVHGSTHTGQFEPHTISAKLAWTDTPVEISLEKMRFATIKPSNPARAGRSYRSLAHRLDIDNEELTLIAKLLEGGKLDKSGELLDKKNTKSALKAMPGPVREQVKVLYAELLLRLGRYEEGTGVFRKLRRAQLENVKWYAVSRFKLLDQHPDGSYNGKPLSETTVFRQAAAKISESSVASARETMRAYAKAMPDKHNAWKNLVRKMEEHEQELRIADSLDPGRAENDIFRLWRFSQDLNFHEFQRLAEEHQGVRRKLEDFKNDGSRSSRQRLLGMQRKLQRMDDQRRKVARLGEDTDEKMSTAGFRIDDPAAAEILN